MGRLTDIFYLSAFMRRLVQLHHELTSKALDVGDIGGWNELRAAACQIRGHVEPGALGSLAP